MEYSALSSFVTLGNQAPHPLSHWQMMASSCTPTPFSVCFKGNGPISCLQPQKYQTGQASENLLVLKTQELCPFLKGHVPELAWPLAWLAGGAGPAFTGQKGRIGMAALSFYMDLQM